jgi:Na+-driven multidrug efflux pump/anti-sigma regulatory factor (Ser/Thr protein kinase)
MISKLYFSILPVQVLIFAMGSINSLVDGTMAGRFIDAKTVGVIGLYAPMVAIITACGSVLLGGTSVLCGRYMGKGELENTRGIFSLNLTLTFFVGIFLMIISFFFPGLIIAMLGASPELTPALLTYIRGYAFGILPMMLSQQLAAFLQMERQNKTGYYGIAGMIISNVVLDVLFVAVLNMGVWGLALATSLCNIIYFLILVPYYFTPKAQLKYNHANCLWSDCRNLIKIGFPGAVLQICIAIRSMVVNRILLQYAGNDGLSAMASFGLVTGFFIAFALGNGAIVRMLCSIYVGEEDREAIKRTIKIVMRNGLILSVVISVIIFILSPTLAQIFFPDTATNVYFLTKQLFMIYSCCVPFILLLQVMINYYQAAEHIAFVNFQSVFDGFFSFVIPALILAPFLGATGVWLANPLGILLTMLTIPAYVMLRLKRAPKRLDDWLLIKDSFGVPDRDSLDIQISDKSELSAAAEQVQKFCRDHEMGKKSSFYSALCLEEMAGNVLEHGFTADKKDHSLNMRAVYKEGDFLLRIKDDCIPFNPTEMAEIVSGKDETDNIGIKMVYKIADDVNYINTLGLNVLTVTINQESLTSDIGTEYLMEKTLRKLDKNLSDNFRNVAFVAQNILIKYKNLFPEYTDHSELHSLTVIDSCNRLIGEKQIGKLNADEIYILLVASYLHDVGMGISEKDYDEFSEKLGAKEYFLQNPNGTKADFVRKYHHEFSGLFIDKYAGIFEIPTPEHVYAIRQVARGHRKTNLYDEKEYPSDYKLPNGNTVCLPYLAALIRIADEIDVVASRNPIILFDIDSLQDEIEIMEHKKLMAVKSIKMTKDAFILQAVENDEKVIQSLKEMAVKMQNTLNLCKDVIEKRTPFKFAQSFVVLNIDTEDKEDK